MIHTIKPISSRVADTYRRATQSMNSGRKSHAELDAEVDKRWKEFNERALKEHEKSEWA